MFYKIRYLPYLSLIVLLACNSPDEPKRYPSGSGTPTVNTNGQNPVLTVKDEVITHVETGETTPAAIVSFARTLTGTPYKYGSINPAEGFDCSGFITYVFNHFKIKVPRTSVGFTGVDREVSLDQAMAGDLVLFTGTDSTDRTIGHMGIVTSPQGQDVWFIHATSGRAAGVTETAVKPYYLSRFVKVVRVFPQNN
jgi:cell wall-associated NlpC family hydrolase